MDNHHKIRTISERTGFSPGLLRAWERRYRLLEPVRLEGGHRLYSDEDLRILMRIRDLLDEGRSIGELAALGREALLAQAPGRGEPFALLREDRFQGEGLGIELRELATADLVTVLRLYDLLKRTYELSMYLGEGTADHLLVQRLCNLNEPDLMDGLGRLGAATRSGSLLVRAALQHTRWGAVSPLSGYAREFERRGPAPAELRTAILLARDHAKMMRNAFLDLDVPLRQADEAPRAHLLAPMLAKIHRVRWEAGTSIQVSTDYQGAISARCLETSTIDRLVYDLVRRMMDARLRTAELRVARQGHALLRFSLELPGPGLEPFQPDEFTALVVGQAIGLEPEAALKQGYLGTGEQEDRWQAWFYWPLYLPPGDVPVCACD
jgi:DNA-binding transcriptional MerR regulator